MTTDLGLSGQESDVNRACSAFGLDTVNYRAFPNNGPVPEVEPEPLPGISTSEPEPVSPMAMPESTPEASVAKLQQIARQAETAAASAPQAIPRPSPEFAPPPFAPMPIAAQQWAQAAPPTGFASGPGNFGNLPPSMPPAPPYPSEQNQYEGGVAGGGADFSLLRQAMPSNFPRPTAPMPAFAMARAPLQPLPANGTRPVPARPAASTATDPESFGIAFGAAFSTAFGTGADTNQAASFQRPPS